MITRQMTIKASNGCIELFVTHTVHVLAYKILFKIIYDCILLL